MKELRPDVNLDHEVAAIVAFLGRKWTPLNNLKRLVVAARDEALFAGRGWIDRYDISALAHELLESRAKLLERTGVSHVDARYFDAYCHLLDRIGYLDDALHEVGRSLDGKWDFDQRESILAGRLADQHPGLTGMVPLGFEHVAGVNENDLCEAYSSEADAALFEGSKAEGVLSGAFPWRVALSTVVKGQRNGLAPWHQLVGAVFGHFLVIVEYLNTYALKAALETALPYDSPTMQFALPERFDNPFLQALLTWAGLPLPKAAFDGSVLLRESLKLPEAQRAQVVNARPELLAAYANGVAALRSRKHHRDDASRAEMTVLLRELLADGQRHRAA